MWQPPTLKNPPPTRWSASTWTCARHSLTVCLVPITIIPVLTRISVSLLTLISEVSVLARVLVIPCSEVSVSMATVSVSVSASVSVMSAVFLSVSPVSTSVSLWSSLRNPLEIFLHEVSVSFLHDWGRPQSMDTPHRPVVAGGDQ